MQGNIDDAQVPLGTEQKKRWKERETVVALYLDRQEVLAVGERVVDDWSHLELPYGP